MSDLATEPRWSRNFGTFGSNADLSSDFTIAYMDGFQGKKISSNSVLTMVKHFPGGGPQEKGLDPHLFSGKNQIYPGNNFNYHLMPFKGAIKNNLKVKKIVTQKFFLEKMGIIERQNDLNDKRKVKIHLTDLGKKRRIQ